MVGSTVRRRQEQQEDCRRSAQEVARRNERFGDILTAAVSPHRTMKAFLGSSTNFTVYSAELYGIILAAILASIPGHGKDKVIICIDNQAAITGNRESGQRLRSAFGQACIEKICSKGVEVELHWFPAHIGIDGNEMADIVAKQATGWRQKKNRQADCF